VNDFRMFRCTICGSIGLNPGACGVCGRAVREIRQDSSEPSTVSLQRLRPFWTGTKIVVTIAIVLLAVSSLGAGFDLSARPSGPSCSNRAVNYPSCNTCGSLETYSASTNWCFCTNQAVNAPTCNRWCANNAINPPTNGQARGCDQCPDNHTDIVCPPGLPMETYNNPIGQVSRFDFFGKN
jgi:hypothetical protein